MMMSVRVLGILLVISLVSGDSISSSQAPPAPILFIINSQPGHFHTELADKSRRSLLEQWRRVVPPTMMRTPRVLLTSEMDKEASKISLIKWRQIRLDPLCLLDREAVINI